MTTRLKVCICWTDISGYMAACWRALAARPEIDLKVIAFEPTDSKEAVFDRSVMNGITHELITRERAMNDRDAIAGMVLAHAPDVISLPGWYYGAYSALADHPRLAHCTRLMSMDNPWNGSLRQHLGKYLRASFFAKIHRVIVAGDKTFEFARRLGFGESRIRRGVYGFDAARFAPVLDERMRRGPWPREFVFIGQYAEKKNLPMLLSAYDAYRRGSPRPWGLTCMGMGPLKSALAGREGVTDLGFVQPADQAGALARVGAFVLPSVYDPWGVAIAEAAGAGLPVVCSEACGAAIELVRSYYNGLTIATGHEGALVRAMQAIEAREAEMPEWGRRGRELAAPYGAEFWAARWAGAIAEGTTA
jgi:glycosyltransferase involved in cell wall biosynthesis